MMAIIGWYYLHENGALIYKRELGETAADIRESPFAKGLWAFDSDDRQCAWSLLVEALAAGVRKERIQELAEKWHCDDEDAGTYAERIGVQLSRDGNQWVATRTDFDNLQESPAGFGDTCLEAMAELCKNLGYQPSKMWGTTFKDLVAP
jgi:hypothetical protein